MKKFVFFIAFILAILISFCYSIKVESISKNKLELEKYYRYNYPHGGHYPHYGNNYGRWHHRGHPGYWWYYPSYHHNIHRPPHHY